MKALELQNVYDPDPQIYKNALNLIRSASLNCYLFEVCDGPQARMLLKPLVVCRLPLRDVVSMLKCRQTGQTPSRPGCRCCKSSSVLAMRARSV